MNDTEHLRDLNTEVADLGLQLRQANVEITRLREQVRFAGEETARLRQENAQLKVRLNLDPGVALPVDPVVAPLVKAAAEPLDNDAVAARKKRLAEEIERARETITHAAMIRQQMAELERMSRLLAEENERLRVESGSEAPAPAVVATASAPAVPSLSLNRPMIRPPQPPPSAAKTAAAEEEADAKLKVLPAQALAPATSAENLSGRRLVFLNSLFGNKPT